MLCFKCYVAGLSGLGRSCLLCFLVCLVWLCCVITVGGFVWVVDLVWFGFGGGWFSG